MSTSIEEHVKDAADRAEALKLPTTFSARDAAKKTTYPVDKIEVYSDAALAHELNLAANEAAKARFLAETIKEAFDADEHKSIEDDIADNVNWATANAEAASLEAKVSELVGKLQESVLIFHLRGLAPKQWRLIDAKWRKEVKPPARKNYPNTEEGEEEYELETYERNLQRNEGINNNQIASGIIKVVRKIDGAEDTHVWTVDEVADINDTYLESEYDKLKNLVVQLTFANNIFQMAVQQDADFLSRP